MKTPVGQQAPATCEGRSKNGSDDTGRLPETLRHRTRVSSQAALWGRERVDRQGAGGDLGARLGRLRASWFRRLRRGAGFVTRSAKTGATVCALARGPSRRDDAEPPGARASEWGDDSETLA